MKNYTLLLMAFVLSGQIFAEITDSTSTSKKDTTSFKLGNMKIFITNDDSKEDSGKVSKSSTSITLGDDPDKPKAKKRKTHIPNYWTGLAIGTNGFLQANQSFKVPAGYNFLQLNQGKSISVEANFSDININLYKKYVHLTTGMGLRWNNYRFDNNYTLLPDSNKVSAYSSGIDFRKNKLTASYITVPLLLGFNTNPYSKNHFYFAAGVIGGLNLAAHTKQVFESAGNVYKNKVSDDYNLSPFTLDATVRLGYRNIAVFANYSMTEMFRPGTAPELHPFSVGIKLF